MLFRINQYNATNVNQSTAKSLLVAELGPSQPQLVFLTITFIGMSCQRLGGRLVTMLVYTISDIVFLFFSLRLLLFS